MIRIITLFTFLILFSALIAGAQTTDVKTRLVRYYRGNNIVKYYPDRESKNFFYDPVDDTINYRKVVDDIYKDTANRLFILTSNFDPQDSDTLVNIGYYKDMTDFFDLTTYHKIKGDYFANKHKVYEWFGNSDGEFPEEVAGADAETFMPFDSVEGGTDKNYVFYGGGQTTAKIVPGANPKTVKVLNIWSQPAMGNAYFVDDKNVFFNYKKMEGADAYSFKLVNENGVDAMDKYRRYYDGKQVK